MGDRFEGGDFIPCRRLNRRHIWRGLILSLAGLLSACALLAPAGPRIHVENPWARPSASAVGVGGVFLTLVNEGREADSLIAAHTDVARAVELHQTVIENEVMKMTGVSEIVVPARGSVELKPGDYHIMLMGLSRDLIAGESIHLVLQFEKSGGIAIEAEVRLE